MSRSMKYVSGVKISNEGSNYYQETQKEQEFVDGTATAAVEMYKMLSANKQLSSLTASTQSFMNDFMQFYEKHRLYLVQQETKQREQERELMELRVKDLLASHSKEEILALLNKE